jgi:hypothetical protein
MYLVIIVQGVYQVIFLLLFLQILTVCVYDFGVNPVPARSGETIYVDMYIDVSVAGTILPTATPVPPTPQAGYCAVVEPANQFEWRGIVSDYGVCGTIEPISMYIPVLDISAEFPGAYICVWDLSIDNIVFSGLTININALILSLWSVAWIMFLLRCDMIELVLYAPIAYLTIALVILIATLVKSLL